MFAMPTQDFNQLANMYPVQTSSTFTEMPLGQDPSASMMPSNFSAQPMGMSWADYQSLYGSAMQPGWQVNKSGWVTYNPSFGGGNSSGAGTPATGAPAFSPTPAPAATTPSLDFAALAGLFGAGTGAATEGAKSGGGGMSNGRYSKMPAIGMKWADLFGGGGK